MRNVLVALVGFLTAGVLVTAGSLLLADTGAETDTRALAPDARVAMTAAFDNAYPASAAANGRVVEVDLRAAPAKVELVEGIETDVWAYNGTVPGPDVRVNIGDTLRITLINDLPQPTSIHWHGIRVPNAMDGVPGINQPAVEPGDQFVYEFTPPDAGTFWFHSHTRGSEQLERGLYGSLVVQDAETLPFSQDEVLVLDDWLLDSTGAINTSFNNPHDITHSGRWGNVVTVNGAAANRLSVAPGERLRLRMINASNARTYAPEIGADGSVVAVDGLWVRDPFPVDGFELAPGNRIDIDLTVPTGAADPIEVTDNFSGEGFLLLTLEPTGEPVTSPEFTTPVGVVPDWAAGPIDHEYRLSLETAPERGLVWTINGTAYPDAEPYETPAGEFVSFRLANDSQVLHPMHFHGQFFKVTARNGTGDPEDFFRDTVLIKPREVVDIAMMPLDAGTWAVHCHIQEHAEAGMLTTLEVTET